MDDQTKNKIIKEIDKIDLKIKKLKAQIKKDPNFNEIVEYSTQLKEYTNQKEELINKL